MSSYTAVPEILFAVCVYYLCTTFHLHPLCYFIFTHYCGTSCAPGSSVGIAADYGLDGPGIESRWGRDFSHTSRPALGPTQLLYNGYRDFPGGKAAGAWC
jgi:hypothetical protein